jgi:leader peptidase (prepilin peptidase)/N-methyltransferase
MPLWVPLSLAAPFVGSFLGVLAVRLPERRAVIAGRSRCEVCKHVLSPLDLVPVLSWLVLRGRCRYCGVEIGWLLPLIEMAALIPVLWASTITSGVALAASCILGWTLLALAVTDWRYFLLPDPLVLLLLISGLAVSALITPSTFAGHLVGVAAGFISLAALAFVYRAIRGRDGLGLGDAKLLAALGAWLSFEGLPTAVLTAAMLGLAYAAACALIRARFSSSDRLPFGSFLALGGWLTWLYGPLTLG